MIIVCRCCLAECVVVFVRNDDNLFDSGVCVCVCCVERQKSTHAYAYQCTQSVIHLSSCYDSLHIHICFSLRFFIVFLGSLKTTHSTVHTVIFDTRLPLLLSSPLMMSICVFSVDASLSAYAYRMLFVQRKESTAFVSLGMRCVCVTKVKWQNENHSNPIALSFNWSRVESQTKESLDRIR